MRLSSEPVMRRFEVNVMDRIGAVCAVFFDHSQVSDPKCSGRGVCLWERTRERRHESSRLDVEKRDVALVTRDRQQVSTFTLRALAHKSVT